MPKFAVKSMVILSAEMIHHVEAENENQAIQKVDSDCKNWNDYMQANCRHHLMEKGTLEITATEITTDD